MNRYLLLVVVIFLSFNTLAQTPQFTRQDTLRGSITPERIWWDLNYYHLDIKVDTKAHTIEGTNTIEYTVLNRANVMQIDLQPPLKITKVIQDDQNLAFERDGNAHFVQLKSEQEPGNQKKIKVYYEGKPTVAIRPPWDGGITWQKDDKGLPFVASSCQGIGASVWWPCKDHMYDEVDSMLISVNVPKNLINVSNGRLRGVDKLKDGTKTFHWFVGSPINNYGVNINIADYVHFGEKYQGENGELDIDYYVLRNNLKKAKEQFKDVPRMFKALEHWFGPYPFYKDSYKLVEAPYLGMEHQSSVTYGNGYQNGYLGNDLSGTGWGLKFDFIIIHESGHEWFANNITYKDAADMWIHESFTNYSENLYLDYHFGKQAAEDYVIGTRRAIQNDRPIVGIYNVNYSGSSDMYYKGGNMLHTLRQIVNDDEKWRQILRGLNKTFYHQTVTTKQIEDYISEKTGMNLKPFFDQYLRETKIPVLEYFIKEKKLYVRWNNVVSDFNMPVRIKLGDQFKWVKPTIGWSSIPIPSDAITFAVDRNFYVGSMRTF